MFDLGGSTRQRVSRLEDGMAELKSDVSQIGGDVKTLVQALSNTSEKASEQAISVKAEIRDETDRKAKDRSSYLTGGLSLVGAVSIIVAAIGGPYVSQITSTAHEAADATFKIGQVRETLAEQGADVSRQQASLDLTRERNRIQDSELREHDQAVAAMKQALADRGMPIR